MLRVRRNSLVSLALLPEPALATLVVLIAWRTAPPEKRPRADRSPDKASQCDAHCHWLLHQPRSVSKNQGRQLREQVAVPYLLLARSNADICMHSMVLRPTVPPPSLSTGVWYSNDDDALHRHAALGLAPWLSLAYRFEWVHVHIYSQRR